MLRNYYHDLKIDKNATADEIKKAFRKLAQKYHPDINSSPQAEENFKRINLAYQVLSDPIKRAKYDRDYQRQFITSTIPHKSYSNVYPNPHVAYKKSIYTKKLLKKAILFNYFSLFFLALLFIDGFLPPDKTKITGLNQKVRLTKFALKKNYHFTIDNKKLDQIIFLIDSMEIYKTPIFKINLQITVFPNLKAYHYYFYYPPPTNKFQFRVDYNIYKTFFLFPILQLLSALLSLIYFKTRKHKINSAINSLVFWIFTLAFIIIW